MLLKEQRLNEVYEYVRDHYRIHTKTDFADALKMTRPALSAAMNGNEAYLTKNLFQKVCAAFPGVFNIHYLITGEGELLLQQHDAPETENHNGTIDLLEMYARMIRGVDDLRVELKNQLDEIRTIRAELQQARDEFRTATSRMLQYNHRSHVENHYDFAADSPDSDPKPT